MAKVTYKPDGSTDQFGYHFDGDNSVDVADEKALAKFAGNPFFEVEEAAKKPAAKKPAE